MANKKDYRTYLRKKMEDLINGLELNEFHKRSLKERWLDQMIWADKKADQCRRWHYRLRLTTILGGVTLPALVGISVQLVDANPWLTTWLPYFAFALSQVIAISAAVEEFCRFGERWRDYRRMSEDLKAEGWQYLQLSGPYQYTSNSITDLKKKYRVVVEEIPVEVEPAAPKKRATHGDRYSLFAGRVESIIKQDVQNYISDLMKQQAKQDQEIEKFLQEAKAVTTDQYPSSLTRLSGSNTYSSDGEYLSASGYAPSYSASSYSTGESIDLDYSNRYDYTDEDSGYIRDADYSTELDDSLESDYPVASRYAEAMEDPYLPETDTVVESDYPPDYPVELRYPARSEEQPDIDSTVTTSVVISEAAEALGIAADEARVEPATNLDSTDPSETFPTTLAVPDSNNGSVPTVEPVPESATPSSELEVGAPDPTPTRVNLNAEIVAAALSLRGFSTAAGPDGGRNACAWTVNRVLEKAGISPLGENQNLVESLVDALKNGRGQLVSREEAKAGDLVIASGDRHIGIGLDDGCNRVLSNSSSRAEFRWESNTDFDGYYGGASTIYRLLR
ncbi:MAG TPA: DUF4231 domain-containing protein [Leptolyngbyaceae cyanobacterium M33_DOE_097]|uniref:DUF4231 domain-containing protein n=1 Tax=Oscillatoriales cyanobacterium SpSt-418 TaxID=2282169 RepID=A0A7C3PKH2_9CYAN|nr:DUF4231 domain-containing protein [Leptolyngbyaceae cyanobacterium M33_DOE_097]